MMEDEVIYRARHGDPEAFRALVETYADVAWRIARVMLYDRAIAEDVMQEALIDLWRGLPRFHDDHPFRPWFLTLVANRCRMAARRRALPTEPLDDALLDTYADAGDIVEQTLRLEADAELHATLAALPAEQRRILELRFFAELDLAEIALILAIPVGTVKSRLHRALQATRMQLQRQLPAMSGGEHTQ